MKKYVLIMLTVVCCWIFCIIVDVYAAGHGRGYGGRGGYYVGGYYGGPEVGYYVGPGVGYYGGGYYGGGYYGGGNRHHRRRYFFRNSPVDGYSCVWTGNNYKCCETWDEDDN